MSAAVVQYASHVLYPGPPAPSLTMFFARTRADVLDLVQMPTVSGQVSAVSHRAGHVGAGVGVGEGAGVGTGVGGVGSGVQSSSWQSALSVAHATFVMLLIVLS